MYYNEFENSFFIIQTTHKIAKNCTNNYSSQALSSPELNAQVSFSDCLLSVVRPSVCL